MNEDKNVCIKINEVKITSKSSYQISVAAIESDAHVNISQPPATSEDRPKSMAEAESKACTSQKTNPLFTNDVGSWQGKATEEMRDFGHKEAVRNVNIYRKSTKIIFHKKMATNCNALRLPYFIHIKSIKLLT